jgi:hypothetical protein
VLKTGHSQFVAGTNRVMNHWHGRGVDIYAVDGQKVARKSTAARAFALKAIALGPPARAAEIGSPWSDPASQAGVFSDGSHQGHLHFGWPG